MLTIVQACVALGCDGEIRYTRARRMLDNYLVGRCDTCGRKFRLFNGRPAEIDRSARVRRSRVASRAGRVVVSPPARSGAQPQAS